VDEKVNAAREANVYLGDPETVWIEKFASAMSHETIRKVLDELEGNETSRRFDKLYFAEFMEKILPNSIHIELWSDALDTCPIARCLVPLLCVEVCR
jgi:hypothetical protein